TRRPAAGRPPTSPHVGTTAAPRTPAAGPHPDLTPQGESARPEPLPRTLRPTTAPHAPDT
ncbi:hypothetical protein ABZS63_35850, partial [Streptomyces sp. NPDC005568]